MKTYTIKPNWCDCHPETCCCNKWAVVDEAGEKYTTCLGQTEAEGIAQALNVGYSAQSAQQAAELVRRTDAFVNEVLPQIGKLCIQDYGNLNELCMLLTRMKKELQ